MSCCPSQVSPIVELNPAELEPVEEATLVFQQDGKDHLLQEIKSFGFTGPQEEEVSA